ncbi:MAG: low molecular weight protein arginine phosphatase [Candidatus Zixiibacteriota bacterium]
MRDNKFVIMFVCTGNTCRSPMAEGALRMLLEKQVPGKFEVISSGTFAADGYPATQYAREAAKMWDIDLSTHASQQLTEELIEDTDLIFAMTPGHLRDIVSLVPEAADKVFLFKNFPSNDPDGEGVEDPIGQELAKYNEVFLEIGEYLGKNLPEIVKRINNNHHE